jgi:hypothetical protein
MAQSRTPYIQTYETKRLEFPTNPLGRSGLSPAKDANLVNMIVDVTKQSKTPKVYLRSRAGTSLAFTTAAGVGRGCYYWLVSGVSYCISVTGNKVYSNGTLLGTLTTSTGSVGFTEHVSSAGVVTLVMCDGINGYVFSNPTTFPTKIIGGAPWQASTLMPAGSIRTPTTPNGFVYTSQTTGSGTTGVTQPTWPTTAGLTVVDGSVTWTCGLSSFPSPHIPAPQFLDGYIFVAKANSEDIYNCKLDDPLTWDGSFISAEMYPDTVVTLSKNNNYIYAIGRTSIEYFYDAANATGTPLARQTPAVQQFGTAAADSVVQTEEDVILVGDTGSGGKTVWTINGFKAKEVGNKWIKGILTTEGANLANATAYNIRTSGQKYYVLQLTSRTLVYNFDTDLWSEWQTGSSNFIGANGTDGPNGTPYLQDATNGNIYTMSENVFTDNGANIVCQIITDKEDFGTINRKFMFRFSLIGDVPDSTGVDNTFYISWTDDDYNTWATDRPLSFNNDFPCIAQLGSFRRRAFRIKYSLPHLVRLEGYEVDINKGIA